MATSLVDDGIAWRAPALRKAFKETSIHPNHTPGRLIAAADFCRPPTHALEPAAERQVMAAWECFVTGEPLAHTAVPKLVLSSWQRSQRAGVAPGTRLAPLALKGDALAQLRRQNHDLLWAAQSLFMTSAHLLENSGSMMLLTDPNGVVLEVVGDMHTQEAAQDVHLIEGGHWHESVVGTNGIGTALAMRRPVQVHAAEHYSQGIKSWTCAAAPIFLPGTDQILGVIDISGPPATFQRSNLVLATTAARQIEAVLSDRGRREHIVLLEACMKFGSPGSVMAQLALDRNGMLIHISGSLPGLELRLGSRLPGLEAGHQAHEWARHLPEAIRPEWLHPVRVDGTDIGAVLMVPMRPRAVIASTLSTAAVAGPDSRQVGNTPMDASLDSFSGLIGHSQALISAIDRARRLSGKRVAVLIQGETGVGKELFARGIHGDEQRSGPFVTFNCGATTKELIGSELFGHVRGAYTGATAEGRAGRFELAHGGTLCLDEIGELPLELQPVLLRALEDGVVCRLGDTKPRRVDVRLLAMTNRDLLKEVENGRFRRDLYHRISVTGVQVPPLRERDDDIGLLTAHFNRVLAARHGIASRSFGRSVLTMLRAYGWPGNVRELRNVVESLLLTSDDFVVDSHELPDGIRNSAGATGGPPEAAGAAPATSLEDTERLAIVRAVKCAHGNLAQAARALGVSRSTLYRKVERYHLDDIVRLTDPLDGAVGSTF